jgi:multidrug transporter EmrE-like cation transporter
MKPPLSGTRKVRLIAGTGLILLAAFLMFSQLMVPVPLGAPSPELIHFHIWFTVSAVAVALLGAFIWPKPVDWFQVLKIYVWIALTIVISGWVGRYILP